MGCCIGRQAVGPVLIAGWSTMQSSCDGVSVHISIPQHTLLETSSSNGGRRTVTASSERLQSGDSNNMSHSIVAVPTVMPFRHHNLRTHIV